MSVLLALMFGAWPFGHHGQARTSRYLIPAWHVDATQDRFTMRTVCRIFQGSRARPKVAYQRDTLAFAFAPSRNTLQAEFQVDGGPVQPWTSVYPRLIGTGATLSGRSMTNPTQGWVILPTSILAGAATVTIRTRPDDRPETFSVGGLADAVASGRRLGCDPDYGFARSS